MNARRWIVALTLCLAIGTLAPGQAPNADNARIDALVRKLGSESFVQREQARRELEAIGPSALERLRLARKTADAECNRRIDELIRRFEEEVLTKQILAPKEIDLKLDGVPVRDAIAELAKASGYAIEFQGDATKFSDKKINISGKTTFWQVLDQICEQGGLMEPVDLAPQAMVPNQGGRVMRRLPGPIGPQSAPAGPIVLVNRGNEKSSISYAGAVKTEVRISRHITTKELILQFVISAEPRLLNKTLVGSPFLDKSFDDLGRALQLSIHATNAKSDYDKIVAQVLDQPDLGLQTNRRVAQIRVKDENAKQFKELTGKLSLQLDLQNEVLARLDKVLDAGGKSTNGAGGGRMKVLSVSKKEGGAIEMQVAMENLGQNPFGNNIIMNGNGGVIIQGNIQINGGGGIVIGPGGVRVNGNGGNRKDLPDLLDAKGQKFEIGNVANDSFNLTNGSSSRTASILYLPKAGQTEPRELVLFGRRTHTIAVPFRFENLKLP